MKLAMLTGGIASGKTTVCKIFKSLGCKIIDADKIAHDVVQKGNNAWQKIIETFGTNILGENQQLDRTKLGDIIFNDPVKRENLNKIVHPEVFGQINKTIEKIYNANFGKTIIVDIPLLFELLKKPNSDIILVYVPQEIQLIRLMKRDGYSKKNAIKRIKSQITMDKKREFSTIIIDNSGSLERTKGLVLSALSDIRKTQGKFTKFNFDLLFDNLR